MDNLHREMGMRIYQRRKQKRWTQEELAEASGVTPQTISSAELGKKALRPENILKICDALEISTDYLLTGRIVNEDFHAIFEKISVLSPRQFHYLENIINNYIAAVIPEEETAL